jgi:hypothetical protein
MKRLLTSLLLLISAGCSGHAVLAPLPDSAGNVQVSFSAMGDVPYEQWENDQLRRQVREIPLESEFVIHLGDIQKNQHEIPCGEAKYELVEKILSRSPRPLFIIPGDNEYNDCINPDEAWAWWVKHLMRFDQRWPNRFRVFRQLEREENFAFVHNGVLFVSIFLVSGRVHDKEEWARRHEQDMQWIETTMRTFKDQVRCAVIFSHAFPTATLHPGCAARISAAATAFSKPVLYLQGDGHKWLYDHPFANKSILRVQVDMGAIAPPIQVRITDNVQQPFYFDRRGAGPTTRPTTRPATLPQSSRS